MVVTAHPDDSEFGAGGTGAKMVKEGREVTYVIITNGNKGSSDRSMTPERLARIREEEQRNAARALGVERVEFLGYADGEVEDTRDLRRDVSRMIRKWRPDLVICQNPHRTYLLGASHRDHRIAGGVTLDCVYPLARDHMAFPELMPTFRSERVEFLGYADGEVEDTRDLRRDVSRMIRKWRPDLVICQNPHRTYLLGASHRDHRIAGGVTLDCVYPLARDHMAFPELMPTF